MMIVLMENSKMRFINAQGKGKVTSGTRKITTSGKLDLK